MNQFLHVLFLFLFTIGLYSCSKDEDTYYVFDVDQEFKIEMKEYFKEGNRGLFFDIETAMGYECENVEIEVIVIQEEDNIFLDIKGVNRHQDCSTGGAYIAKKRIVLEDVEDSHDLRIVIGETIHNNGKLLSDNDEYEVTFDTPLIGLKFKEEKLKKMPEKAIWGRFYTNQILTVNAYSELKNHFNEFDCEPITLDTGNYTHFNVLDTNTIQWKEPITELYEHSFVYKYDGDDIKLLGNTIARFDSLHSSNYNYNYSIFVYNGDVY